MGRVGPAERGGAAAAVGGQGTVLYCTVLYCTVLYCDKATGQMMSSVRLYLLPEYTAEGRQPHHGEVSHGEQE